MRKIGLSYTLSAGAAEAQLRNPLIAPLRAVHESGSIAGAAEALGLSYRHVWGELKRWEGRLGEPLLLWEKGTPARLTAASERLLRAEALAQARLAPQIEAVQAQLARSFARSLRGDDAPVLSLCASHDETLSLLRAELLSASASHPRLDLDIRHMGSVDAVQALAHGRCSLAAFHTLRGASASSQTARAFRPLLKPASHQLIGLGTRTQGLMLAAGNPRRITGLADSLRPDVRFIHRPQGSGTRVLLDDLLAEGGLRSPQLAEGARTEPTSGAAAQAVAAGDADAAFGTEAVARARGLAFVALAQEELHLVCPSTALDEAPVAALRAYLASARWRRALAALPGHTPGHSGEVRSLTRALPWWRLGPSRGEP